MLAVQGAFREHISHLERSRACASEVRTAAQLDAVAGLIIPGGESTTIARLLLAFDLMEPIRSRIQEGMPVWGTCAGAILLAREVPNLDRPSIGAMAISVRRNAFGRQVDSFETELTVAGLDGGPLRAVFIRAPLITVITEAGDEVDEVEVLATLDGGDVVACRQGSLIATVFHPELTEDLRFHHLFVNLVRSVTAGGGRA